MGLVFRYQINVCSKFIITENTHFLGCAFKISPSEYWYEWWSKSNVFKICICICNFRECVYLGMSNYLRIQADTVNTYFKICCVRLEDYWTQRVLHEIHYTKAGNESEITVNFGRIPGSMCMSYADYTTKHRVPQTTEQNVAVAMRRVCSCDTVRYRFHPYCFGLFHCPSDSHAFV